MCVCCVCVLSIYIIKIINYVKIFCVVLCWHKWDKVFKNGPREVCRRQPLKNLKWYHFKFFKGCLPQISLGPFLNTLSQISYCFFNSMAIHWSCFNFYESAINDSVLKKGKGHFSPLPLHYLRDWMTELRV